MALSIGVVEDNPSLRKRFVENFKYFGHIDLEIVAASGEEFLRKIEIIDEAKKPEIVLMDIELPGIDGIQTTALMKEKHPEVDIIMLTVFEHTENILNAIKAGAVGYLLKDESPSDIVDALEELKEGGAPMSKSIARKLVLNIEESSTAKDDSEVRNNNIELYGLSDKEVQIIQQLVNGKNYHDISELMFISPHTVKTHIKNIYKKMHVHSRASAVKTAIDLRIAK